MRQSYTNACYAYTVSMSLSAPHNVDRQAHEVITVALARECRHRACATKRELDRCTGSLAVHISMADRITSCRMGYQTPAVKSKHFNKYVEGMPSCESKVYAITGTTTGALKSPHCTCVHTRQRMNPSFLSTV